MAVELADVGPLIVLRFRWIELCAHMEEEKPSTKIKGTSFIFIFSPFVKFVVNNILQWNKFRVGGDEKNIVDSQILDSFEFEVSNRNYKLINVLR